MLSARFADDFAILLDLPLPPLKVKILSAIYFVGFVIGAYV